MPTKISIVHEIDYYNNIRTLERLKYFSRVSYNNNFI